MKDSTFKQLAENWLKEQMLGIEENELNIERAEKLINNYKESIKILKTQNRLKIKFASDYIKKDLKNEDFEVDENLRKFFIKDK